MKDKIQLPSTRELQRCLTRLKAEIQNDYLQEDDDEPSMQITLASDERGYALQTGDNSYSGPAYSFRHWAVGSLYRQTDCTDLARDLINECKDLAAWE